MMLSERLNNLLWRLFSYDFLALGLYVAKAVPRLFRFSFSACPLHLLVSCEQYGLLPRSKADAADSSWVHCQIHIELFFKLPIVVDFDENNMSAFRQWNFYYSCSFFGVQNFFV